MGLRRMGKPAVDGDLDEDGRRLLGNRSGDAVVATAARQRHGLSGDVGEFWIGGQISERSLKLKGEFRSIIFRYFG